MSNVMRVIAKAGGYRVVEEMSGCVAIEKDNGTYLCDRGSAYELIAAVPEPEIRAELLAQWKADLDRQHYAETRNPEAEHGI